MVESPAARDGTAAPLDLVRLGEVAMLRVLVLSVVLGLAVYPFGGWRREVAEVVVPIVLVNAALSFFEYRFAESARSWPRVVVWGVVGWVMTAWALVAATVPHMLSRGADFAQIAGGVSEWGLDGELRGWAAGIVATAFAIGLSEEGRRRTRRVARAPLVSDGLAFFPAAAPLLWSGLASFVAASIRHEPAELVCLLVGGPIAALPIALAVASANRLVDSVVLVAEIPETTPGSADGGDSSGAPRARGRGAPPGRSL